MVNNLDFFIFFRLYVFYPSRIPSVNSTEYALLNMVKSEFKEGGMGRSAFEQAGYQFAALMMTLVVSIVTGFVTGWVMRLTFFEQIRDSEDMFDDEPNWEVPEGFSLELKGVKGEEMKSFDTSSP